MCRKAGVAKIDAAARGAIIAFHKNVFARPDLLLPWISKQAGTVQVRPDQKLIVMRAWDDVSVRPGGVKRILEELSSMLA